MDNRAWEKVEFIKNKMNATSHLYSKTSAGQILNVKPENITKLEVWANCIFVQLKGNPAKMVSMKKFKEDFVEKRKQNSRGLEVIPAPLADAFVVKNTKKDTQYMVYLVGDRIECGCEDYGRQIQQNPTNLNTSYACCKHIYAVLNYLGHSSLKSFVERN